MANGETKRMNCHCSGIFPQVRVYAYGVSIGEGVDEHASEGVDEHASEV